MTITLSSSTTSHTLQVVARVGVVVGQVGFEVRVEVAKLLKGCWKDLGVRGSIWILAFAALISFIVNEVFCRRGTRR